MRRLLTIGAILLGVSQPASATATPGTLNGNAAGDRETHDVITSRLPNDGVAYPVLTLSDLQLREGEPMLLFGRYRAAKVVTGPIPPEPRFDNLQQTWITCSTGRPRPDQSYPTRSALSSRNHEGRHGVERSISVLWLFTPGTAEWYQPEDVHLTPNHPRDVVLEHRWTAHPAATSIDAFHGTQASSTTGGPDPFVIDTTLRVTQLDAQGEPCAPATTVYSQDPIYSDVHHLKINKVGDGIPIRTGNGCTRTFDLRVDVDYVQTLPPPTPNRSGMVHGPVPVLDPLRPYTTAIAMNNFQPPAQ